MQQELQRLICNCASAGAARLLGRSLHNNCMTTDCHCYLVDAHCLHEEGHALQRRLEDFWVAVLREGVIEVRG